ncbi:MAG: M20/M25/M40 family metallo-hydrolase [Intestinimonas sp.]
MSHQDVVEAPGAWKYPPSPAPSPREVVGPGGPGREGQPHDIFQAVEELMEAGYTPEWDVYIAASHEEETGGNTLIVDFLREQGIVPEMLVDEGSSIQPCPVPGFDGHAAMVSVAEKGYIDVKCVARGPAATPASPARGRRCPAWAPSCARWRTPICSPSASAAPAPRCTAAWRPSPPTRGAGLPDRHRRGAPRLAGEPGGAAEGDAGHHHRLHHGRRLPGRQRHPQEAYVICNIRVAPGETVAGAVAALQAVADRHQVELEVLRSNEPSPVTDPRGEAFVRVERAIQAAWPGTEVLPFLLSGGTDTKHFVSLCPNCLRFTAYRISADQQVRCHAIDENIDLDTIPNGVDFFKNLIQGL